MRSDFVRERLNGEDGLGAIFPAMVNAVLMFDALGYPPDQPDRAMARRAIDNLLVVKEDEAYCQPCVSPVWDTVLASHALLEVGDGESVAAAGAASTGSRTARSATCAATGRCRSRTSSPAAGPFSTPIRTIRTSTIRLSSSWPWTGSSTKRGNHRYEKAIRRAERWIAGLQSRNGGWAAFDADNTCSYLDNIPFSDHGALLDPPSPDLTARCVSMLAQRGATPETSSALRDGLDYLRRTQRPEGSWYGRWGINYIYGTWSVLSALNAAGIAPEAPEMRERGRLAAVDPERGRRLGRGRRSELPARL